MSPGGPYLTDTTVLVDVSRNREPATSWFGEVLRGPDTIVVSAVVIAEFFAGLHPGQRLHWLEFVDQLACIEVTRKIAIHAGILRYDLARQGRALLIPDALIAASALAVNATLATSNVKDFAIPGISIISLLP